MGVVASRRDCHSELPNWQEMSGGFCFLGPTATIRAAGVLPRGSSVVRRLHLICTRRQGFGKSPRQGPPGDGVWWDTELVASGTFPGRYPSSVIKGQGRHRRLDKRVTCVKSRKLIMASGEAIPSDSTLARLARTGRARWRRGCGRLSPWWTWASVRRPSSISPVAPLSGLPC